MAASPFPSPAGEPWIEVTSDRQFAGWLAAQQVSLAFSTYQTGKLFVVGRHADGRLAVMERNFARCMGLWADGQTAWVSSHYQLWRLENVLRPGETHQGCDRRDRLCRRSAPRVASAPITSRRRLQVPQEGAPRAREF